MREDTLRSPPSWTRAGGLTFDCVIASRVRSKWGRDVWEADRGDAPRSASHQGYGDFAWV